MELVSQNLAPLVLCAVVVLVGSGLLAYRRGRYGLAFACILGLGVLLRWFAATDAFLHPWDERFHAVVAKNCMSEPLRPMLYRDPALPYDYRYWLANHVWLHKPPLSLWLMAGSMKVFGVNELALRLPSVLLSSLLIVLAFRLGTNLWSRRHGLLAALLCAVNCHLVNLASGRAATDHVDTLLIALVTLGVYLSLSGSRSGKPWVHDTFVGVVGGLAYLAKGLPGLFVPAFWGLVLLARRPREPAKRFWMRCLFVGIALLVVAAPWSIYTHAAFPRESAWESAYSVRHVFEALEGHAHPWSYYLKRIELWLGPVVYVALLWAVVRLVTRRDRSRLLPVLAWFLVPHIVFSAVATKMPAYATMSAVAGFLLIAVFAVDMTHTIAARWPQGRWQRSVMLSLLLVLLCLPLPRTLKQHRLVRERDRAPAWSEDLRHLAAQHSGPDVVVFGVPHAIEAMFYADLTAYNFLPDRAAVEKTMASGRDVVVFDQGSLPGWVHEADGIRVFVPRTKETR